MLEYIGTDRCRMSFLREQLDDPAPEPCGRCDNCGGLVAAGRRGRAARWSPPGPNCEIPGVAVEPRAQWPSAMSSLGVQLSGRIPVAEKAETGRAVGRLDGIGWGSALRTCWTRTPPDGEVPVPLRHAVVQVLDGWLPAWGRRAVRTVDRAVDWTRWCSSSRTPAELVRHLAERAGPLPVVAGSDDLRGRRSPAADQRDQLRPHGWRRCLARHRLADPAAVAGKRILLVDDVTETGWTLTVAARELRQAGALAVFPLVLAVR